MKKQELKIEKWTDQNIPFEKSVSTVEKIVAKEMRKKAKEIDKIFLANYRKQVEEEFEDKCENINIHRSGWTSKKDVLQLMFDNRNTKIWWYSWELNGKHNSKGSYLSHRACARASDLAYENINLVEMRKVSRFAIFRLRLENLPAIIKFLE